LADICDRTSLTGLPAAFSVSNDSLKFYQQRYCPGLPEIQEEINTIDFCKPPTRDWKS
jgi:hypothetical protein